MARVFLLLACAFLLGFALTFGGLFLLGRAFLLCLALALGGLRLLLAHFFLLLASAFLLHVPLAFRRILLLFASLFLLLTCVGLAFAGLFLLLASLLLHFRLTLTKLLLALLHAFELFELLLATAFRAILWSFPIPATSVLRSSPLFATTTGGFLLVLFAGRFPLLSVLSRFFPCFTLTFASLLLLLAGIFTSLIGLLLPALTLFATTPTLLFLTLLIFRLGLFATIAGFFPALATFGLGLLTSLASFGLCRGLSLRLAFTEFLGGFLGLFQILALALFELFATFGENLLSLLFGFAFVALQHLFASLLKRLFAAEFLNGFLRAFATLLTGFAEFFHDVRLHLRFAALDASVLPAIADT